MDHASSGMPCRLYKEPEEVGNFFKLGPDTSSERNVVRCFFIENSIIG